jgi:predicted RNA-binding protein with PIN domain
MKMDLRRLIIPPVDRNGAPYYNDRMPILIDGHNLIPKIPGMHLSEMDDEMRLVELLQSYCRLRGKGPIECFFDKAPEGDWPKVQRFGQVRVQFARRGTLADAEIEARLEKLGREARNWLVVSSDNRVRKAARAVGARDQTAESFANELVAALKEGETARRVPGDKPAVSADEVDYWLTQFRKNRKG